MLLFDKRHHLDHQRVRRIAQNVSEGFPYYRWKRLALFSIL
jgi:hypothetical protein